MLHSSRFPACFIKANIALPSISVGLSWKTHDAQTRCLAVCLSRDHWDQGRTCHIHGVGRGNERIKLGPARSTSKSGLEPRPLCGWSLARQESKGESWKRRSKLNTDCWKKLDALRNNSKEEKGEEVLVIPTLKALFKTLAFSLKFCADWLGGGCCLEGSC